MFERRNTQLTLNVLRGALYGGSAGFFGGILVLTLLGILAGYGPFLALYYLSLLIFYALPIGMFIGALIAAFLSLRFLIRSQPTPNRDRLRPLRYIVWLAVPLLLFGGLLTLPSRFIGIDRVVTHAATWTTNTTLHPECPTPLVILMPVKYASYEEICSPELLNALQTQGDAVIPIQYRVTSDFGKPRSYQLIHAGTVEIGWEEWVGGPSGCGGQYTPPCDSPKVHDESMLYTSSWPETAVTQ